MEEWWGSVGPAVVAEGDKGLPFSLSLPPSYPFALLLRRFVFHLSPFVLGRANAFAPRFEFLFSCSPALAPAFAPVIGAAARLGG